MGYFWPLKSCRAWMTFVADSKVSSAKSGDCPWAGLGPAGGGHKWVVTWFWGRVWAAGGTIVDDSKVWNSQRQRVPLAMEWYPSLWGANTVLTFCVSTGGLGSHTHWTFDIIQSICQKHLTFNIWYWPLFIAKHIESIRIMIQCAEIGTVQKTCMWTDW